MTNKVIFTQDVPGERAWLATQFPNYTNYETKSSGKWPCSTLALDLSARHIYEVPWNDHSCNNSTLNIVSDTYKSFYSSEIDVILNDNTNWVYADSVISNVKFKPFQNLPNHYYQALHIARSGTVFVESLLQKKYQRLSEHNGIYPAAQDMKNIVDKISTHQNNLTVALIYTSDFWRNLTSTVIANHYGFYHYDSSFNWGDAKPVSITIADIEDLERTLITTWNFWCNIRNTFPSIDFYFLNGAEMISKYSNYSTHTKIKYDKINLIKNYYEAKEMFDSTYYNKWQTMFRRISKHLSSMGCKLDLDNVLLKNESI